MPIQSSGGIADSPSDEAVVAAVLAGDRDAFEVLVVRYGDRLYQHARWMAGSRDVAQDIVQASFLKAYLHLGEVRGHMGSWLLRIVVNGCRDWAKADRRQAGGYGDTEPEALFSPYGVPDRELVRAELRGALEKAVATLSPVLREAFVMHYVQGLPYEAMAAVLDCAPGTLRTRVLRAKEQLRRVLGPLYQEQG